MVEKGVCVRPESETETVAATVNAPIWIKIVFTTGLEGHEQRIGGCHKMSVNASAVIQASDSTVGHQHHGNAP